MSDVNKTVIFEQFARKAKQRLEERKKFKTEKLKIKSMGDEVLEIRGLSDNEISDCMDFSTDSLEVDRYTIYMASVTLQEAARVLVNEGALAPGKEYKITEIFTGAERNFITRRVLQLSGVGGEAEIEVISENEEVKNS